MLAVWISVWCWVGLQVLKPLPPASLCTPPFTCPVPFSLASDQGESSHSLTVPGHTQHSTFQLKLPLQRRQVLCDISISLHEWTPPSWSHLHNVKGERKNWHHMMWLNVDLFTFNHLFYVYACSGIKYQRLIAKCDQHIVWGENQCLCTEECYSHLVQCA